MATPVPGQKATIEKTLGALCKDFKLDDKVRARAPEDMITFASTDPGNFVSPYEMTGPKYIKTPDVSPRTLRESGFNEEAVDRAEARVRCSASRETANNRDTGTASSSSATEWFANGSIIFENNFTAWGLLTP